MSHQQDPYSKGGFYALIFSIVFCLLFFVYISFVHHGVDLDEAKVAVSAEATVADAAASAAAVDVTKIEKPWEENADMISHGATVFKTNCAVCHGNEGRGDGPAGKSSVPPARNLVDGKWTAGGSSQALFNTIKNGLPNGSPMAPFGHLSKVERWSLVQYIRSITKNKTADNAAELAQFAESAE
jgi:mono/diheme cytochrome c family protein